MFCISYFIFVSCVLCAKMFPAVHARFTFMETKAGKIVKKESIRSHIPKRPSQCTE